MNVNLIIIFMVGEEVTFLSIFIPAEKSLLALTAHRCLIMVGVGESACLAKTVQHHYENMVHLRGLNVLSVVATRPDPSRSLRAFLKVCASLLHAQIIIVHRSHKSMPLVIQHHTWRRKITNIDSQSKLDQRYRRSEFKWRAVEH